MIKFNKVTRTFGDETAGYEVVLDKEYTVLELFNEIVSRNRDWGKIRIKNGSCAEYKWGKIISYLDNNDLNKKVLKVTSHGGWSMMDYLIYTAE